MSAPRRPLLELATPLLSDTGTHEETKQPSVAITVRDDLDSSGAILNRLERVENISSSRLRKFAKIFGVLSLLALGVGIGAIALIEPEKSEDKDARIAIMSVLIAYYAFLIGGSIGIATSRRCRERQPWFRNEFKEIAHPEMKSIREETKSLVALSEMPIEPIRSDASMIELFQAVENVKTHREEKKQEFIAERLAINRVLRSYGNLDLVNDIHVYLNPQVANAINRRSRSSQSLIRLLAPISHEKSNNMALRLFARNMANDSKCKPEKIQEIIEQYLDDDDESFRPPTLA